MKSYPCSLLQPSGPLTLGGQLQPVRQRTTPAEQRLHDSRTFAQAFSAAPTRSRWYFVSAYHQSVALEGPLPDYSYSRLTTGSGKGLPSGPPRSPLESTHSGSVSSRGVVHG